MVDALSHLLPAVVRRLSEVTGLPVAASDGRGRLVASSGPGSFCPLVAREEDRAAPLPPRCEECARVRGFLACEETLAPCPNGADVVRPIMVGGRPAGWLSTAILPGGLGGAAAQRAARDLDVVALVLAAVVAAERRDGLTRSILSRHLLEARVAVERARGRLAAGEDAEGDLRAAKGELDCAHDSLRAFREAPSPAADVVPALDGAS